MSDEEGFLQTIIANPDDDAPRLVYSDWLEDHGYLDRAEFIRVQCELARMSKDDLRFAELDRRERGLRKAHFEEWIAPLRAVTHFYKTLSEFRRGFVEYIQIRGAAFLEKGPVLFEMSPIRRLEILAAGAEFVRIVMTPCLARLTELRLYGVGHLTREQVRTIVRSPFVSQLRVLFLPAQMAPSSRRELLAKFGERIQQPQLRPTE